MAGELATLVQGAAAFAAQDIGASSRSGYRRDLARFETWVREHGLGAAVPGSPEIVATYLAALASGRVRVRWIGKVTVSSLAGLRRRSAAYLRGRNQRRTRLHSIA